MQFQQFVLINCKLIIILILKAVWTASFIWFVIEINQSLYFSTTCMDQNPYHQNQPIICIQIFMFFYELYESHGTSYLNSFAVKYLRYPKQNN